MIEQNGERHIITTSAREIKRIVIKSSTSRFANETSMLAMKGDFDLLELEHGLVRVEKVRSDSSRSAPSHASAVAHAGGGQTRAAVKPGLEVEAVDEVGRAGAQAGATTTVVAVISKDIHADAPWTAAPATLSTVTTVGTAPPAAQPGAAGEDHPTNSGEEERTTSVDHGIGEETRLTSCA